MSEKDSIENQDSYMMVDETGMLVPDYDQTIKVFDDGDIVVGEVVKIDRDEVLVDIGYKSEGAIPLRELSIRSDVNPFDVVSVGDRIEALVLQKEDKDGRLILSKKRADYEKSWERIEKIAEADGKISGTVIEVVKGGLIVDIGLRGFLPASLVDTKRAKDLNQYIGQEMECRIIEMDRNRNNVVLSRKAVLEEEKKQEKSKLLENVEKGTILTGKISSIVDFGAFVDLGGIDGLIHISELSWSHIDHPSEVVSIGDEVKVQVLDIDFERERISLGLRQTQEDPWKQKASKYCVGQTCTSRAIKLVPFGVFVELEEGLEGLIHISELAHKHVEMPEEVVKVNDVVEAKVVGIDFEKRRISLSIKQLQEPPAQEESSKEKTKETEESKTETISEEIKEEAATSSENVSSELQELSQEITVETTDIVITEETSSGETVVEEIIEETITEENISISVTENEENLDEKNLSSKEDTEKEENQEDNLAAIEQEVTKNDDSLESVLQQMKAAQAKKSTD